MLYFEIFKKSHIEIFMIHDLIFFNDNIQIITKSCKYKVSYILISFN